MAKTRINSTDSPTALSTSSGGSSPESQSLPVKWTAQPPAPAMTGQGNASPAPGRGIKPLFSWKAHKWVGVTIFLVIALLGVPVAWIMGKPGYATEAVIRVSPRFIKNLNSDPELELQSNSQYREFVQQQVYTINRFDIVSAALEKLGPKRSLYQLPAENDRRVVERLARELTVKPVPDSYLITIGLEGGKAEGLAEVVNAVVGAYLERAKGEELFGADQRRETVNQERDRVQQTLNTLSERRTALGQELGLTTFTPSMLNPYDQLVVKTRDEMEAARRNRILAEARLDALEKQQGTATRPAVEAMSEEQAIKDAGLNSLKSSLFTRRGQLLSKLSGISPEHPGRPSIERELNDIEAELRRATEKLTKTYETMTLDQRRADVFQARQIEQELMKQIDTLATQATWFASRYHEAVAITAEIDRQQKRLAALDDRSDFFKLEANAPGWVRLVTPARQPDLPMKGGKKKFLAIFLVLAVVLGAAVPIVIDLLDPRLYVAGQLQKMLGFPPVGWILDRSDPQARDFAEDQLVRLATNLNRDRLANGTRVIAFTSTKTGEGVSTLSLDLACALTSLGLRAVVIEANSLLPDPRYQGSSLAIAPREMRPQAVGPQMIEAKKREEAQPQSPGLSELLEGQVAIDEAIAPRNELLPARLSVGKDPERRPLGTLAQYRQTLTALAGEYDFVLIDTAPVLLSVDTELLVGLADATLLIVEAGALSKGEIKRAVQALERLSPPTFGAILNRVKVIEAGGAFADLLREHQSGARTPASRLLSPWLWK
ncbi:MAG: AAA family ATPase [Blastocatellia bacterium]|nr:AAA family ATPase [Blastocatellia bacterium]